MQGWSGGRLAAIKRREPSTARSRLLKTEVANVVPQDDQSHAFSVRLPLAEGSECRLPSASSTLLEPARWAVQIRVRQPELRASAAFGAGETAYALL